MFLQKHPKVKMKWYFILRLHVCLGRSGHFVSVRETERFDFDFLAAFYHMFDNICWITGKNMCMYE